MVFIFNLCWIASQTSVLLSPIKHTQLCLSLSLYLLIAFSFSTHFVSVILTLNTKNLCVCVYACKYSPKVALTNKPHHFYLMLHVLMLNCDSCFWCDVGLQTHHICEALSSTQQMLFHFPSISFNLICSCLNTWWKQTSILYPISSSFTESSYFVSIRCHIGPIDGLSSDYLNSSCLIAQMTCAHLAPFVILKLYLLSPYVKVGTLSFDFFFYHSGEPWI